MRFSIVAIVIRLSAVTFLTVTVWSVQAKRPLLSRPESSLVRVIFVVPSSNVPPADADRKVLAVLVAVDRVDAVHGLGFGIGTGPERQYDIRRCGSEFGQVREYETSGGRSGSELEVAADFVDFLAVGRVPVAVAPAAAR